MGRLHFVRAAVAVTLAVAFLAWLPAARTCGGDADPAQAMQRETGKKPGRPEGPPPGWEKGKKEGWENQFPPGWSNWDEPKRQEWQRGLARAKEAIRKREEARLVAALRALEMAARKGAPISTSEEMVKAGLERGLGPFDFEPLGKFVVEKVRQGLRGEELSRAVHEEVRRRQEQRHRRREQAKEKKPHGKPSDVETPSPEEQDAVTPAARGKKSRANQGASLQKGKPEAKGEEEK